ncbi:head-tail connector protein [Xanthobacter sp. V4C-4]|uniref:head-tail connector protein n=1 Tax=Xanthobacter cornucopiae TaxID=3119924 RepID=UPI0037286735
MPDTLDILPLADIKGHLRMTPDENEEDIAIAGMIETARGFVEGWCGPLNGFTDGVPAPLVHAMKLYVAHLHSNREATFDGTISEAPLGFFDLIDPYRLRTC